MLPLTEKLRFGLSVSPETFIARLRSGTSRFWSPILVGDSIASASLGPLLLVWRSTRGPLRSPTEHPIFLGSVRWVSTGAVLVGRFAGPGITYFHLLFAIAFLLLWFIASLWPAIAFVVISHLSLCIRFRPALQAQLELDRPLVEACLQAAGASAPAA